eukprot:1344993-Rhodomonas_salina.1
MRCRLFCGIPTCEIHPAISPSQYNFVPGLRRFGLVFRVAGRVLRVPGLERRVHGLGLHGFGLRVHGLEVRVHDLGLGVHGLGPGEGSGIWGRGLRDWRMRVHCLG